MKVLLKKEVCGSRKQCTGLTGKALCLLKCTSPKKKKKEKKKERKLQMLGIKAVSKRVLSTKLIKSLGTIM